MIQLTHTCKQVSDAIDWIWLEENAGNSEAPRDRANELRVQLNAEVTQLKFLQVLLKSFDRS